MLAETAPAPAPDATDMEELLHLYCSYCYPNPQIGDSVRSFCGVVDHYLGDAAQPDAFKKCARCVRLEWGLCPGGCGN